MELNHLLESINPERLIDDVRSLVEESRRSLARTVNTERVMLYWHMGRCISEDLPAENRADYGAKVVELVSERLTAEYGKGFRCSNVFHMIRFAEVFDALKIVQTLYGLLSWSISSRSSASWIICSASFTPRWLGWRVRTLRQKVKGILYERTSICPEVGGAGQFDEPLAAAETSCQ